MIKSLKMKEAIEKLQYTGVNYNKDEDDFTQKFTKELKANIWHPEEIPVGMDLNVWQNFSRVERVAYARNLQLLTYFDTYQGDLGMPVIQRALPEEFHQRKAFLGMAAYEESSIHAKSYSYIFQTLLNREEEAELENWAKKEMTLQRLVDTIVSQYKKMNNYIFLRDNDVLNEDDEPYQEELYKTMVSSVFLESYLFYSGFFYPLYFYAQGKLMQCGEIINLIIRDELLHGLYISKLAKEIFNRFTKEKQKELEIWVYQRVQEIHELQRPMVELLYGDVGLVDEVLPFCRYNANAALMNLGFKPFFPNEIQNQAVINGLSTKTKDSDIFSLKGNGYQRIKVVAMKDEDFIFDSERTALKVAIRPKDSTLWAS